MEKKLYGTVYGFYWTKMREAIKVYLWQETHNAMTYDVHFAQKDENCFSAKYAWLKQKAVFIKIKILNASICVAMCM